MFGLEMRARTRDTAEAEARQWLDMVGLAKFENSYPHELSGGMKQRVAIARALANEPRILIMDEPFAALDAQTRCQMQSYLLQIWKKVDVTILFITHDLDEAAYLADRILVMGANPGRVRRVHRKSRCRVRAPPTNSFRRNSSRSRRGSKNSSIRPSKTRRKNCPMIKLTEAGDEVE